MFDSGIQLLPWDSRLSPFLPQGFNTYPLTTCNCHRVKLFGSFRTFSYCARVCWNKEILTPIHSIIESELNVMILTLILDLQLQYCEHGFVVSM